MGVTRSHCPSGHPYSDENVAIDKRDGSRYCKACKRIKARVRIDFKGFQYKSGFCKYGHKIEDHAYVRGDSGTYRCGACALNTVRRRRDAKSMVVNDFSRCDEVKTRVMFNDRCFNCNKTRDLQIDHHYPLSLGFGLTPDNAVLLCKTCNASKNSQLPEEFYCAKQLQVLNYLLALV